MPMNLAPAQKNGKYQTRHPRLVVIDEPFEVPETVKPGEAPKTRTCWRGRLFMSDAKTVEGTFEWEADGRFRQAGGIGVGIPNKCDLQVFLGLAEPAMCLAIEQDAEPVPASAEPSAPAPKNQNSSLANQVESWQDTARHFSDSADFYRGIVNEVGGLFGEAARTSDDGSVQDGVLALKVPNLVRELLSQNKKLRNKLARAPQAGPENEAAMPAA
jgi:hypothetical protein